MTSEQRVDAIRNRARAAMERLKDYIMQMENGSTRERRQEKMAIPDSALLLQQWADYDAALALVSEMTHEGAIDRITTLRDGARDLATRVCRG